MGCLVDGTHVLFPTWPSPPHQNIRGPHKRASPLSMHVYRDERGETETEREGGFSSMRIISLAERGARAAKTLVGDYERLEASVRMPRVGIENSVFTETRRAFYC